MGVPLRQGRFFDDHDRADSEPVVVIDEVLALHAFPHQDAVGKRLFIQAMGTGPIRVVGVVGHVRHWGLADAVCPSPRPVNALIFLVHVDGCPDHRAPLKSG